MTLVNVQQFIRDEIVGEGEDLNITMSAVLIKRRKMKKAVAIMPKVSEDVY